MHQRRQGRSWTHSQESTSPYSYRYPPPPTAAVRRLFPVLQMARAETRSNLRFPLRITEFNSRTPTWEGEPIECRQSSGLFR